MWIKDVEREILREREENKLEQEQGGKTQADRRSDKSGGRRKPRLSKRETLLEMLMGAVVGGAGGSRRPRKIETGGSNLQQEARGDLHIFLTSFDADLKPEGKFFSHALGFVDKYLPC